MKKIFLLLSIVIINSSLTAQVPPQLQPGEKWTNMWSDTYDLQSFGSVRYLVQDPADPQKLCAVMMGKHSSDPSIFIRKTYYAYSTDFGNTWTSNVLDDTSGNGPPSIALRDGKPIIKNTRMPYADVYQDNTFGGSQFELISGVPNNLFLGHSSIAVSQNSNIILFAGSVTSTGYNCVYNGISWSPWNFEESIVLSNYTVEAGMNNMVFASKVRRIFPSYSSITLNQSTDNGITFSGSTEIFNYFLDGTDTAYAANEFEPYIQAGGIQSLVIQNEPHIVFTVKNPYYSFTPLDPSFITKIFYNTYILHWSPSTGVTKVAGKFNIPNLADTIKTANMLPLCQPSIGIASNGDILCTYTTFLRGNKQVVLNQDTVNTGEIFISRSTDNGITWSLPKNITNTPFIEEKHSSLLRKSESAYSDVFYVRDMEAGNWTLYPDWGAAPVYGISKNIDSSLVGVRQNSYAAETFVLSQNYPNPFNPSTKINFSIPRPGFTSLIIYDALGKEITRIVNESLNAGSYEFEFSADKHGLSSGVYFYKLISGDFSKIKRMVLIK